MNNWVRSILAGIGAVVVASFIISHLSSGSGTSSPQATAPQATTAAESATGRVGSSFSVADGADDTYSVTLGKVIDPAHSSDSYDEPDNGTRFIAAVFIIRAVSGSPRDEDADNSASVTGSNGQSYSPQFAEIAGYTNFDNGTIHVAQGQSVTGAVVFQVPDGVKVEKVQWTPQDGFSTPVQWVTSSAAAASSSGESCNSQVAAWKAAKGDKATEAAITSVEAVSDASSKLAADGESGGGEADAQALETADIRLHSDIQAARAHPAPLCIRHLRADDKAYFASASGMATALSRAAAAYVAADYASEADDLRTANSRAVKMNADLDTIGRDMKTFSSP